MSLYDRVRDLPLSIEGYELEGLALQPRPDFVRKTTLVRLLGGGEEGLGEDVVYDGAAHDAQLARGAVLAVAGEWTLASFSEHLGSLPLFEGEPAYPVYAAYRRWAFESAALDLALRQNGLSLAGAVGRELRPLTYVVSMGLGKPPSTERLRRLLDLYPGLRCKLDATDAWTDELVAELVSLDCVDSLDLKSFYDQSVVGQGADPDLYRRVADAFPDAWLEDPALTDETLPVLEPHADRVTWDYPIHSVEDIESLRWKPKVVNVKPSRFGTVERLFAGYDHCEREGIGGYGGGQFELGVGRGQIQYLAALFHPDGPNDVAPGGFNDPEPAPGMPRSPLAVEPRATGFAVV